MYYTIQMNPDKSLQAPVRPTIYQREKLVDKIQFLLPQSYDQINIQESTVLLKYVDAANVVHSEFLKKDEELYKNYVRFLLPIDTNLTKFAGDIVMRLTIIYMNSETQSLRTLHTGEHILTVLPLKDYYAFVNDESLEIIDQKLAELDAKIEMNDKQLDALSGMADKYMAEKADDLLIKDNVAVLLSQGKQIGTPQKIEHDMDVVEFDSEIPEGPETPEEPELPDKDCQFDVIEF